MNKYNLSDLYSLYVLEYKKDKPLFEPVSVMEFFNWLIERERLGGLGCLSDVDEGQSPFDSVNDTQADYMEDGR